MVSTSTTPPVVGCPELYNSICLDGPTAGQVCFASSTVCNASERPSHYFTHCLSPNVSLTVSLPLFLSLSLCHCLSHCFSLSLSNCLSHCFSHTLSHNLCERREWAQCLLNAAQSTQHEWRSSTVQLIEWPTNLDFCKQRTCC